MPIAIIAASFLIRNTRQEHRFLDRIPGKLGCNERNKTPIDFLYRLPILSARAICTSIDLRIYLFLRSDIEGRNVNLNSDSFFFLLLLRIASNLITFRSRNENVSSQISINTRFNLNSIFTKERNVLFDITVLRIVYIFVHFNIRHFFPPDGSNQNPTGRDFENTPSTARGNSSSFSVRIELIHVSRADGPPLPFLFVGRGTSFITVMHKPP